MKSGAYFFTLLLAVACLGLAVALILMAHNNQKLQVKVQAQQQMINQGVLGPQAQQISSGVLQDMANAAIGNSGIRQLLEKHGYRLPPARPPEGQLRPARNATHSVVGGQAGEPARSPASAVNPPGKQDAEPFDTEAPNP